MANKIKSRATLKVRCLGQILEGTVEFGDLTLLVGSQASGKSIFLQLLKLLIDRHQAFENLKKHGYDWGNDPKRILDLYFGESMSGIWSEKTAVFWNDKSYALETLASKKGPGGASKELVLHTRPTRRYYGAGLASAI
ncbi:MAG: hypothetical protein NZM43_04660 [Saprospiraceae bacterium]|nr:hypothetical protein [Saprospiraceae bacterium]MDW8483600.1 hypothetical protein [Saprospiraceae bacterium]